MKNEVPYNFRYSSSSSNFFNFYSYLPLAFYVKTLALIREPAFTLYTYMTFFCFFFHCCCLISCRTATFSSLCWSKLLLFGYRLVWVNNHLLLIPTQLVVQPHCCAPGLEQRFYKLDHKQLFWFKQMFCMIIHRS